MDKASYYIFSINGMFTLEFTAGKFFMGLKYVAEKGNEMIAF